MGKILFVCNTAAILVRFRLPLLKAARRAGYEVICVCGLGINSKEYVEKIQQNNFSVKLIPGLEKSGFSIYDILSQSLMLSKIINDISPNILHSFTHRGNIVSYLSLYRNPSVRFIPNVTGAGRLFGDDLLFWEIFPQRIVRFLYRCMSFRCECIFFQNSDDLNEIGLRMGMPTKKLKLTNGSGFDPKEVSLSSVSDIASFRKKLHRTYDIDPQKKMFLLPSRALYSKGVEAFYYAAKNYLELFDDAVFVHAGEAVDDQVYGLSQLSLQSMQKEGIYYIGFQSDIYDLINASDVVVLPSFYREGIPRALIEALAFGKAIITSDSPGCRETVINGWNGQIISSRRPNHLLAAMVACRDMDFIEVARNSKHLFLQRFHVDRITEVYLHQYSNEKNFQK